MRIARSKVSSLITLVLMTFVTQRGVAQAIVQGQQGLTFGVNLPGVNRTIAPTDAVNAGRFYVRHRVGGQVRLTFALPKNLQRSGGGNLKVVWPSSSATIQSIGSAATTTFNPNNNRNHSFTTSPDINVRIGGTVQPKNNQASGTYTGTITLTVAVLQ